MRPIDHVIVVLYISFAVSNEGTTEDQESIQVITLSVDVHRVKVDDQVVDHRAVRSERVELSIDAVLHGIDRNPVEYGRLNLVWLVVDVESSPCIDHLLPCSCLYLH